MTKILIVEDEQGLVTLLSYNLEKQGYTTAVCMDGHKVMATIANEKPDLILLDWMLPNISGVELCQMIRQNYETKETPIIMLTARGDEADKVKGLSQGADDYMTKPFSVPELMARIGALLRRTKNIPVQENLSCAGIEINFSTRQVTRDGQLVHMGPTEFRLLQELMQKPGHVISREDLLRSVWGGSIFVELRTVDVHIKRLRQALNFGKRPDIIRTVRSAGYAINIDKN
ncbi:MAG: phosphate regulon transcriptional regulator PhoB [Alphaproteobacteria bacterium]|nr:phosphate regulon transcriptional regulator PhoB [Alphaproteobacteria bacterium]